MAEERPLEASTEMIQELMRGFNPVDRLETLAAAFKLAASTIQAVWLVESEDVHFGRQLLDGYPGLGARDLLYLASCRRRRVRSIKTFDRALEAAFDSHRGSWGKNWGKPLQLPPNSFSPTISSRYPHMDPEPDSTASCRVYSLLESFLRFGTG